LTKRRKTHALSAPGLPYNGH